jgi:hypothetical protein
MTATQILEYKLDELLKCRKSFYKRKKRISDESWIEDRIIKWHKEDNETIKSIRKALKTLNNK